jgi:hypothetical protein
MVCNVVVTCDALTLGTFRIYTIYTMYSETINPQIFIDNRKRFVAQMEKNSIAIFNSNDEIPSNGDALYPFKQNTDLYWLTGIKQEDSMLILFPGNPDKKYREVLVLVRPNELKEKWDGKGTVHLKQLPFQALKPSFGWTPWMVSSSP